MNKANDTEAETEIYLPVETKKEKPLSVISPDATQGQSLMQAIERVALNPNADIGKMEKLMEMYKDHQAREAELAFDRAMSLCQGEMQPVVKTAFNKHTKSMYAKLEDICRAINPIYSKHGFSVTSKTAKSEVDGCFLTITHIRHNDGHKETIELDLPIDDKGKDGMTNKTSLHGVASTISYARRYSICMGFNVATGDDNDGNQAENSTPDVPLVTEEQVFELMELAEKHGVSKEQICNRARINALHELRQNLLDAAKDFIEKNSKEPAK